MHQLPSDWPQDGPIDLTIHDLPHDSSDTEWWYFNAHLTSGNEYRFSIFACFFMKRSPCPQEEYNYCALWALSDLNKKQYHTTSYIDKNVPRICLEKLKQYHPEETSLKFAFEELLKKNKVPSSDILITHPVLHPSKHLKLDFGELILEKQSNETYLLTLENKKDELSCRLVFEPQKPPVRQGNNGRISGPNSEQMFYYFIPRCKVHGELFYNNQKLNAIEGVGWFDHEFGVETHPEPHLNLNAQIAWTWMSIQLDHDYEISLYCLYDTATQKAQNLFCTVIDPSGRQLFYNPIEFHVLNRWKSLHTFNEYASYWAMQIADIELNIEITAEFEEQEFLTVISYPGFWEGRCKVYGMHQGQQVTGYAYIEQTNLNPNHSIEDFFSSVSDEVTKEINELLPLKPDYSRMLNLIASHENADLIDGVDLQQFIRTVVSPIRAITDRSGKRWRSYALAACCHLVGGDFKKFRSWLAVPELIHTGSLIIDDIQDQSPVRRGGPACHILFGEPHAINVGTLSYGLFHIVLKNTDVSFVDRCKIYELYFDTFRAAHTGQAIDIDGHLDLMAKTIKTRDFDKLQKSVIATHRLKSAVPAASLARMGAILGQGSETQIAVLGNFFESVGIAFQIMDDVLNLRGFKNNLKILAEDIVSGKVTYPIAKSLEFFDSHESDWILSVLTNGSEEPHAHQRIIEKLESCGVLDICCDEARSIVDQAWHQMEALFSESHTLMMLRAFSYYVINRHY